MSGRDGDDGSGFDAAGLARDLLRATPVGGLATLEAGSGAPFVSLVTVATDGDGTPLLLLSRLAVHTQNLAADPRASLLLAATGRGDPLAHPRLTVSGTVEPVPEGEVERVRRRFLARHPKSALYVDFPDFSFRRLRPGAAHLNGGFARAASLGAADILTDLAGADALVAGEADAITHMNQDHADAIAAYATALCGRGPGDWRLTGLDPDGADLADGGRTARLRFPRRAMDLASLRGLLVELAAEARGRAARS